MNINADLISKYNVAAPRYTSYPTVPFWEGDRFRVQEWLSRLSATYSTSKEHGVSLYIHLPFCESLCTYCGCNTRITKNHGVEEPYLQRVLKEWTMYRRLLGEDIMISELHLGGGTPTFFDPGNLRQLVEGVLAHAHVHSNAAFSFEAHPANTTKEHLQVLHGLGFRRLSLGIQDFDVRVQFLINRRQTRQEVETVMKDAKAIGYTSVNFDLIYGLPLQTKATVAETVDAALTMSPERISFYSYAHIPWLKPGQRRFTDSDLPTGSDKLELYMLGKRLIEAGGYRDVGMDHFAKDTDPLFRASATGGLHRNFMGYTDRYTPALIGLGVSSIGDSWSCFSQNVKSVEEYYRLIDEGKFPILKGHVLNKEDMTIRRYIVDMMCRGEVRLENGFYANGTFIQRMEALQKDGLVEINGSNIRATPEGRSFLRNICMVFDQRLHNARQKDNLFSRAI